ncbi:hypothetical protein [Lysinibacillus capsici]|uniref:hypothetical protein n=1 Tax=Lysinibacillus capsici TaxID=2115968 RepID=UPI00289CDC18|nr:hypothetical protein [Lysinibacillus capsici]
MKSLDERLLKAVISFSDTWKVSMPKTNDLLDWWKNAVYEMQPRDIKLLFLVFKNVDECKLADHFPQMIAILGERYNQLQLNSCGGISV